MVGLTAGLAQVKPNKRSTDEVLQDMEAAAVQAAEDLLNLDQEAVKAVADWWRNHYLRAGHKRLGRVLIGKY